MVTPPNPTSFFGFLSTISEALWVGILTATVALLVVLIQNRSHRKSLELQLDRDAIEKERDRKVSYRKDVYLNYVAQGNKAFSYIGTLPFKNLATENPMMEVVGFSSAVSQTAFIVDDETSLLLLNLNKQMSMFMMGVVEKMRPISDANTEVNLLQKRFDVSINEQRRVNTEQLALIESGIQNEVRSLNLRRTFEWHAQQLAEIIKEQEAAQESLSQLQYEFMQYIPEHLIRLGELNVEIIARLRTDLGIETDVSRLKPQMDKARDAVLTEAKRVIDEVHQNDKANRTGKQ